MPTPRLKRVYDPPSDDDGLRVLVDRLWPRGLSKEAAAVDLWLKDIAPSDALRHHLHDEPEHWERFRAHYLAELADNPELPSLRATARKQRVTLLYGSRDTGHNNAVVLREALQDKPPT